MRILHISDLHIKIPGNPDLEKKALREFQKLKSDYVVVTGDSTSGKSNQLEKAREFIDNIPGKKVVVPGNTDYNDYLSRYYESGDFKPEANITISPNGILNFTDFKQITEKELEELKKEGVVYLMPIKFQNSQKRVWMVRKKKQIRSRNNRKKRRQTIKFQNIFLRLIQNNKQSRTTNICRRFN